MNDWPTDQTMIFKNNAIFKCVLIKANCDTNIASLAVLRRLRPHLQPLNDVPVIFGSGERWVSSGRVASWYPPIEDGFLYHIVGLHEQVVHLTVQIHRDGDRSALG